MATARIHRKGAVGEMGIRELGGGALDMPSFSDPDTSYETHPESGFAPKSGSRRWTVIDSSQDFDRRCRTCHKWKPGIRFPQSYLNKPPYSYECSNCIRQCKYRRHLRTGRKIAIQVVIVSKQRVKRCTECLEWKAPGAFFAVKRSPDGRNSKCKACRPDKYYASSRSARKLAAYGLTIEGYAELLDSQGGVCAICTQACTTGNVLAVDHCHETGRVRGLLCRRCNQALGGFKDSPHLLEAAATYVRARGAK